MEKKLIKRLFLFIFVYKKGNFTLEEKEDDDDDELIKKSKKILLDF
jgi:hypothetical protein